MLKSADLAPRVPKDKAKTVFFLHDIYCVSLKISINITYVCVWQTSLTLTKKMDRKARAWGGAHTLR